MARPLRPPPTAVTRLLDAVLTTSWPTSTADGDAVWRPLGILLGDRIDLPAGHDDILLRQLNLPLEEVEGSLSLTADGRPSSLGFFLYHHEGEDADRSVEVAFEAVVAAMTKRWGSDVVDDRGSGARLWRVRDQLVELYRHPRGVHPRTQRPVGPACLQVGLGPAELSAAPSAQVR